jgi:hypothetical protein
MRHQPTTLATLTLTIVSTGYLYVAIPKGFFSQDTEFICGLSEARRTFLSKE